MEKTKKDFMETKLDEDLENLNLILKSTFWIDDEFLNSALGQIIYVSPDKDSVIFDRHYEDLEKRFYWVSIGTGIYCKDKTFSLTTDQVRIKRFLKKQFEEYVK